MPKTSKLEYDPYVGRVTYRMYYFLRSGHTVEQLAWMCSLAPTSITKYLNGDPVKRRPQVRTVNGLKAIAKKCGVSEAAMWGPGSLDLVRPSKLPQLTKDGQLRATTRREANG